VNVARRSSLLEALAEEVRFVGRTVLERLLELDDLALRCLVRSDREAKPAAAAAAISMPWFSPEGYQVIAERLAHQEKS